MERRSNTASPDAPLRVVMVVGNEVTPDTRVKKMAASAARGGFDVTILGLSKSSYRWETEIGDIRIIRVPLEATHRSLERERKEGDPRLRFWSWRLARAHRRAAATTARRDVENMEFQARAVLRKEELQAVSLRGKERLQTWLDERRRPRPLRIAATQSMQLGRWMRSFPIRLAMARDRARIEHLRRRVGSITARVDRLTKVHAKALTRARLRRPAGRGWRDALPELHDFDTAFGPALEDLQPDIIHAHDMHMIGIAARAAARLRGQGRHVKWIYDAHEYVRGLDNHMDGFRWRAYIELQAEYISLADEVVTVSEPLADFLTRDHDLAKRPTVVLNAPLYKPDERGETTTIRERIGLPDDVPLLVYSGRTHASRGVDALVGALQYLPEVHVALVCGGTTPYVEELRELAAELHAGDRLHVLDYVASEDVVEHLTTATVGVNLLIDCLNHQVALPNKFFEYLHAGLPILNADVGASAELVREMGVGETFIAEDAEDLARSARALLSQLGEYRKNVEGNEEFLAAMSWQEQEKKLLATYGALTGRDVSVGEDAPAIDLEERSPLPHVPQDRSIRLLIGPSNMAGQARSWAQAVTASMGGVYTETHCLRRGGNQLTFRADVTIPIGAWKNAAWQHSQLNRILDNFTHVLFEGGSPLAGGLVGSYFTAELPLLQHRGIRTGLVFHGSDLRDPRQHRELEPHSPFGDDRLTQDLQRRVDRLRPQLAAFEGPVFASTNDLLDYAPTATWLPVVVDLEDWAPPIDRPALTTRRPKVMHLSTNNRLKGSHHTLEVCRTLEDDGLLELIEPGRVAPEDLPTVMREVDVYIDGTVLGDYGVTACQAMAMNRLVIGNVSTRVRDRIATPVPILQADPDDLEEVLCKVCDDPSAFTDIAEAGRPFVETLHDGRRSAAVLQAFLQA